MNFVRGLFYIEKKKMENSFEFVQNLFLSKQTMEYENKEYHRKERKIKTG